MLLLCSICRGAKQQKKISRRFFVGKLTALLLLTGYVSLAAANQSALNKEPLFNINIPAVNVAQALNQLSEQTDVLLLFPYNDVKNITANSVIGKYTVLQALNLLLKDSGLAGRLSNKGLITVDVIKRDDQLGTDMKTFNKNNINKAINNVVTGAVVATAALSGQTQAKEEEQARGIEVITVEARRKVENLQETPLTVVALSEDSLKNLGVKEIKDISKFAPGLNIEGGVDNNTSRFFIRGVGTATPTFGNEQAVPIYIDDIYTPLGIGGNIDLFSVDRVEVLNGPQGTLYGRNSLGGAIKVYSKQFSDETEGKVEFAFGSFEQRNVKAEIQTPIIEDKLFFGAAFASIQNDGIQNNVYTNTKGWQDDKELYRIRIEARPTEAFTAKYTYERNESAGAAKQLRVRPGTAGLQPAGFDFAGETINNFYQIHTHVISAYNRALSNAYAAGLDPQKYPLVPTGNTPFLVGSNNPYAGDEDNIFSDVIGDNSVEQESHTLNLSWHLNENSAIKYLGAHRSQFNTRLFDIDGGPAAFLAGAEEFTFAADSHELRYELSSDKFEFALGAFYYEEDSDALQAFTQPFGFFTFLNDDSLIGRIEAATASGDFSNLKFEPLVALQDPLGGYTGTNLVSLRNNLRQHTESTAFYLNMAYQVNEKLSTSFGIRSTEDKKLGQTPVGNNDGGALITLNTAQFPGTGNFFPSGGLRQFFTEQSLNKAFGVDQDVAGGASDDKFGSVGDLEAKFRETTVELTVDYKLSDDMFAYGSFKQGFQGGQLIPIYVPDNTANIEPITTPIKINAYELGLKTTFDNKLRLNSSFYMYDWSDLILFQPVAVPVTTNTFQSVGLPINSAEATTLGFETNAQYLVTDNLTLTANLSYNDFSLDSAKRFDPESNRDIEVKDEFVDEYVSSSPKYKISVGLEYYQELNNGSDIRWWTNASWRDKMSVNAQSSFQNAGLNLLSPGQAEENFFSDSFTNLTAGVTYSVEDWRVDLSINNILDERVVEATVNSVQGSFFGTLESYNAPRTWLLSVSYSY